MIEEVKALQDKGYNIGEIDYPAVEQFMADASGATKEQLTQGVTRMVTALREGRRVGKQSIATMGETIRRMRELIEEAQS